MMYWFFFRVYACRLPHAATLEEFDAKMQELAPDLAAIADSLEVKTRLFTCHPYRAYRRKGSFCGWSAWVYRTYIWVALKCYDMDKSIEAALKTAKEHLVK